ncbi:MAG: GTPase [Acidobacteriota bacterium]|nr:GTPase [Acidobacteriota bacterium]
MWPTWKRVSISPRRRAALADPVAGLAGRCRGLATRLEQVARRSESARRIREGARVVLVGPPNAGKSSLFNRLLGEERVLVTSEPGTTRDLIEEVVVIEGLPVVLVDAAGIGPSHSQAEKAGMERALGAARVAALVLRVCNPAIREACQPAPAPEGVPALVVATHADRPWSFPPSEPALAISSLTGEGIDALRRELARRLQAPGVGSPESVALATERHRRRAEAARQRLLAAAALLDPPASPELAAAELRGALGAFEEILGAVGPEELLGRTFSRFCIGK